MFVIGVFIAGISKEILNITDSFIDRPPDDTSYLIPADISRSDHAWQALQIPLKLWIVWSAGWGLLLAIWRPGISAPLSGA